MEKAKEFSYFCSDQKVQEWLKDVFQDEDIHSFDGTPEFVEALKTIMAGNEAAEKDARAIIKAEKSMKNFCDQKAEELQLVTDFIQLNSETCQRVESLASLAEKMKLKEPSLTNFLLGMTEIEDRELVKVEKKIVTSHHVSVFHKKKVDTSKMNEKLRRYLKSLDKVVEKQKTHYSEIMNELKYLENKKRDIDQTIKKNEESLEAAGYLEKDEICDSVLVEKAQESLEASGYPEKDGICHSVLVEKAQESLEAAGYLEKDEIRHSVLVEKAQEYKNLEEQLKTLENKLQVYHSLKPNLESTADAVKGKEKELLKLDEELQLLLQIYENL